MAIPSKAQGRRYHPAAMTRSFAKALGTDALLAYAIAMDSGLVDDSEEEDDDMDDDEKTTRKTASWCWVQVAHAFIEEMEIEEQGVGLDGSSESDSESDADLPLGSPEV
jgi:hypothetical protein